MYRYLDEVSRDINVVEELGAEARCIYVRALEDSVIGFGSAGDLIPLKKDEELLIFFPQGIDVVRVASGRVEMILATSSREAVVGFLRLRSVRDILSRLRNLSFENGRLLVKALVENPELIVALSAENDSVLAYGKDYDNDVVRPIAVDNQGRLRMIAEIALSAETDSVEAYGRDYENNVVRPIVVDEEGRIISRPAEVVETVYDDVVNVNTVETNPIDCRAYRSKTIYVVNGQDVDIYVSVYGSPDSVSWVPLRENVTVPANDSRALVSTEHHPFLKISMKAASSPSTGKVTVRIAKLAS